ncbi:MAG: hypothetical protein NTZ89_06785 [Actinobacteria bacterium]|nr:hypothetical protein [Actinomycetota bacterium]
MSTISSLSIVQPILPAPLKPKIPEKKISIAAIITNIQKMSIDILFLYLKCFA